MLLAYIDRMEPLVANAHAQIQMKQAIFFYFFFFFKICVGPCFFATVVVTPLSLNINNTETFKINKIFSLNRFQMVCCLMPGEQ